MPSVSVTARALVLVAIWALGACVPEPTVRPGKTVASPDAAALALRAQGDYAGAAAEYERRAETDATQAPRLRLQAAFAWLRAGDTERAAGLGGRVASDPGHAELGAATVLFGAALALARGDSKTAATTLTGMDAAALPAAFRPEYHDVSARVAEASDRPVDAVNHRFALEPLLDNDAERAANRNALWLALSRSPIEALVTTDADAVRAAWFELARIARTDLYEPQRFARALSDWRGRYPAHPAEPDITAELVAIAGTLAKPATHLALLLPLTGPHAGAGAAVRDGVLAAWYHDASASPRPRISIFDTNATNVSARYAEARAAGADFVIGPLDKPAVEALVGRGELPIQTLALNQIDQPIPPQVAPRLFQFGLAPEGEARQVAERARSDGHTRALAMVPEGEWGDRVADAFERRWKELGGELLETERYQSNYARTTRSLLNIDDSIARARAIEQVLGRNVVSVTRRRRDAHFLFLAAFSAQARQIRPQLEYFFATDLPVYSTSHVYGGAIDPERDQDLNGIRFGDVPWLVSPAARDAGLYEQVRSAWPGAAGANGRLYALGIDAYRLLGNLGRLRAQPGSDLAGQTGAVGVDANGRVWRRLAWARFAAGRPVPLQAGTAH